MSDLTLTTRRLLLRPWRDDDLPLVAAITADSRGAQFYPSLLTRTETDAMVQRIRAHFDEHGFGLWAVEIPAVSSCIGYVGLMTPRFEAHFTPCVEIGWRLACDHWGRGYATEAALAAVAFGFQSLALDQIVSFTVPANIRSRRVMERIGMTHSPVDDFEHPGLPEKHPLRRHVLYRLSRSEWTSRNPPQMRLPG